MIRNKEESTGDIMIAEVILIHNSNITKKKKKRKEKGKKEEKKMLLQIACKMKYWDPPTHTPRSAHHPCSSSAPRDLLGEK